MVWAEIVMGRFWYGPIWLWAEMTSDLWCWHGFLWRHHEIQRVMSEIWFTELSAEFRMMTWAEMNVASDVPSLRFVRSEVPFHNLGKNRSIVVNDRWRHSSFVNKHVCRPNLCKLRFVPLGFRSIFVICMESCWKISFSVRHRFTICQLWHTIQLSLI